MKTSQSVIKLVSSICWLCVHVAIALWAITWAVQLTRNLRGQFRNKMVVQGTIM